MALRKIIEAEGKSVIQTPFASIENGTQRVSFSAYVKVTSIVGNKNQVTAIVDFSSMLLSLPSSMMCPYLLKLMQQTL